MTRIYSGIMGFDTLFEDGIPRNGNILVFGKAGTGKTIFGLEYIYRGAEKFKESGLYVTLDQTKKNILDQAERFGWNLKKYSKLIKILEFKITDIDRTFAEKIIKEAKKIGAKRVVIDNLSILSISPAFATEVNKYSLLYGDRVIIANNNQQFIYNLIHLLNQTEATNLYLTTTEEEYKTKDGVSEYVCDGIIALRNRYLGRSSLRTLELLKMRQASYEGGIHHFEITNNGFFVGDRK